MLNRIYALFIAVGMAFHGVVYLSWSLTPPGPDRIGYWFIMVLFGWPLLGLFALLVTIHTRTFWIGGPACMYTGLVYLTLSQPLQGIGGFLQSPVSEWVCVGLWACTVISYLLIAAIRYRQQGSYRQTGTTILHR